MSRLTFAILSCAVLFTGTMGASVRGRKICCRAMTAQCLSCAAGQTVKEYCAKNPTTAGCPTTTAKPPTAPPGRACCKAMTAQCLACAAGNTVKEYCAKNPTTAGCSPNSDKVLPPKEDDETSSDDDDTAKKKDKNKKKGPLKRFGRWAKKIAKKAKRGLSRAWTGTKNFVKGLLPKKNTCPVPATQPGLNLDEFIRKTWYIQKQQENDFQPKNKLFCVAATYRIEEDRKVPLFGGKVISVYNYANEDKVNGKPVNGVEEGKKQPGLVLCGRVANKDEASKLLVAPCFLPNIAAGDYWILGAGGDGGKYDWAVVSGGPPTRKLEDGCTTKKKGINGSGLWIFTRKPVDPAGTAEAIKVLKEKGYATSELVDVPQEGCSYNSALIK